MIDRIEQLQAEQKNRVLNVPMPVQMLGELVRWLNTALTEALDIAAVIRTDRAICRETIAEQDRLLERAKSILTDSLRTKLPGAWLNLRDQFLSDLDARSAPALEVSEASESVDVHKQGRKHRQPWCLTHDAPMVCSAASPVHERSMTDRRSDALSYEEAVSVLHYELVKNVPANKTYDTDALTRESVKLLDAINYRQLVKDYEEACVELAEKDERIGELEKGWVEAEERHCVPKVRLELALTERDAARALADQLGVELRETAESGDWPPGYATYPALAAWEARGWK